MLIAIQNQPWGEEAAYEVGRVDDDRLLADENAS